MRSRRIALGVLLVVAGTAGTGCDTGLVTGYQPRRLGDSPAARRAYYAGKYTPESRAADTERADEFRTRRPTPSAGAGPAPN